MSTGLLYEHGMPYKNRNSKLLEGVWAMGVRDAVLPSCGALTSATNGFNLPISAPPITNYCLGKLAVWAHIITEEQLTAEPFLRAGNKSIENCLMLTAPLPLASKPLGTQSQLCFQHRPT